jgi:hypothetical protein
VVQGEEGEKRARDGSPQRVQPVSTRGSDSLVNVPSVGSPWPRELTVHPTGEDAGRGEQHRRGKPDGEQARNLTGRQQPSGSTRDQNGADDGRRVQRESEGGGFRGGSSPPAQGGAEGRFEQPDAEQDGYHGLVAGSHRHPFAHRERLEHGGGCAEGEQGRAARQGWHAPGSNAFEAPTPSSRPLRDVLGPPFGALASLALPVVGTFVTRCLVPNQALFEERA